MNLFREDYMSDDSDGTNSLNSWKITLSREKLEIDCFHVPALVKENNCEFSFDWSSALLTFGRNACEARRIFKRNLGWPKFYPVSNMIVVTQ